MTDEKSKDSVKMATSAGVNSINGELPAPFETLASLIRSGQVPSEAYESWLKNEAFRKFYLKNYGFQD